MSDTTKYNMLSIVHLVFISLLKFTFSIKSSQNEKKTKSFKQEIQRYGFIKLLNITNFPQNNPKIITAQATTSSTIFI